MLVCMSFMIVCRSDQGCLMGMVIELTFDVMNEG